MTYSVGPKGQIVIAREIRRRLGVESGWIALQHIAGDHVEIFFVPPEHKRSLKGSLARHIKESLTPGKDWHRARDAAWKKAVRRKIGIGEGDS